MTKQPAPQQRVGASKLDDRVTIRLSAYDLAKLETAASNIVSTVLAGGGKVSGPFPLPGSVRRLCLNASPHVYGSTKEHFTQRIHRRLVQIRGFSLVSNSLSTLALPSGVHVENIIKSNKGC